MISVVRFHLITQFLRSIADLTLFVPVAVSIFASAAALLVYPTQLVFSRSLRGSVLAPLSAPSSAAPKERFSSKRVSKPPFRLVFNSTYAKRAERLATRIPLLLSENHY